MSNVIAAILVLAVLLGILVGIPVAIFFAIKHLIKFTTRTIYEERANAEERHRQNTHDEP